MARCPQFWVLNVLWLLLAASRARGGSVLNVPSTSSLFAALSNQEVTTIVLDSNYTVGHEFEAVSGGLPAIEINRNVTMVGAPGTMPLLDLQFQRSVLQLCGTCKFTFENMSIANERRGNGASVDFFLGKPGSIVVVRNAYRVRLACTSTNSTLELIAKDQHRSLRIPSSLPGDPMQQLLSRRDVEYQGRQYNDMVWLIDYAYDVPLSFQEGKGMVGGYTLNTINVSRLCQNLVPASCLAIKAPDACVNEVIDQLTAEPSGSSSSSSVVPIVVGVAVGVGALAAAGLSALLLLRRRRRKQQQQQQQDLKQARPRSMNATGGGTKGPGNVPDIEEGIDPNADDTDRQVLDTRGWSITAMCTTPALGMVADTRVHFGKCLGAGSYGRVYKARWAAQDVAVKVIEHDSETAAAVANEVQLMMGFSHNNIVRAFHYITFTQVAEVGDDDYETSTKLPSLQDSSSSSKAATSSMERHHQLQLLQHRFNKQQQVEQPLSPLGCKYAYTATPAADLQAPSTLLTPPLVAPSKPAAGGSSSGWDATQEGSAGQLLHQQRDVMGAVACAHPDQQPQHRAGRSSSEYPQSDGSLTSSQEQLRLQEQLLQQQLQRQLHQQLSQASGSEDTSVLLQRARSGGSSLSQARQVAALHLAAVGGPIGETDSPAAMGPPALGAHDTGVALLRPDAEDEALDAAVYAAERDLWAFDSNNNGEGSSNPWLTRGSAQAALLPAPGLAGLRSQPQRPPPRRLKTWLVQEYCDGGTLTAWVAKCLSDPLEGDQMIALLKLLQDAAQGLAELHQKKVVHGDLNARNVLVSSNSAAAASFASGVDDGAACSTHSAPSAAAGAVGSCFVGGARLTAKLADLGMSRVIKQHNTHRTTNTVGTMSHMPPELLRYGRMSPGVDVYAFGIMMWELFTRSPAFKHLHYGQFFEHVVLRQVRPPVPPDMPGDYSLLMTRCWDTDPDNRPTAACVIECLALMTQARQQQQHHPLQQQQPLVAQQQEQPGVQPQPLQPQPEGPSPQQQVQQQLQARLGEVQVGRQASWDAMGMLQDMPYDQWQGSLGWQQSDGGQVGEFSRQRQLLPKNEEQQPAVVGSPAVHSNPAAIESRACSASQSGCSQVHSHV